VKRLLEVALGVLTAIGGFVDIGELVTGSAVGARFEMRLAWATLLALVVIIVFAEMAGRVAAVSGRPVFDLVRERLGPRFALANLVASFIITAATVAAEVGGVALALELATSVTYLAFIPLVAFLGWLVVWRLDFDVMENVFGLAGLALLVTAVAVWHLGPDWGHVLHQMTHPAKPSRESWSSYLYYAIAMFGAGVMPYEVFFFSSGGVEDDWDESDLVVERTNVFIGFPIGALLTLSLMLGAALVFAPQQVDVTHLSQVALPSALALGKLGLALAIIGFVACTFGAVLETTLACGYSVAQYFGWPWGKSVRPAQSARFHLVMIVTLVGATLLVLTRIDPVMLTELVVVFSAAALPLTYLPVLIVANDREYMGDRVNSRVSNLVGTAFLIVLLITSIATIPLLVLSRAGA
jgi:manganese transport protein